MTKKQIKALQNIQSALLKASNYIQSEHTFVCSDSLPNALSYYNKDGKGLTPMNKQIGSDLCYLGNAIRDITYLITSAQKIEIPVAD